MRMSDMITAYILRMLEEEERGYVELQRNELAGEIGCVPSQINYVLGSRFTPENGYIVESRRGGGGYIRVRRIRFQTEVSMLTHIVNSIGDRLVETAAFTILQNLHDRQMISSEMLAVMSASVSDRAYRYVSPDRRDYVRADVMKYMLTSLSL
ncbi:MAG: CtsR family transcriptional regulator [Clostridia bacterium]|nr:CtsR family transcriptional regulator [Clostridia bacterium]